MSEPVKWHPDLPAVDLTAGTWALPGPLADIAYALCEGGFGQWTAEPANTAKPIEPRITLADIEAVEAYRFDYGGVVWTPENNEVGTELSMAVLARLHDGRYLSILGWNDYTGWGCQDDATIKVGTRDEVIAQGFDNESRGHLGLTLPEAARS